MRKINSIVIYILSLFLFCCGSAYAVPTGQSELDYSTCYRISNKELTIKDSDGGVGYYTRCMRASCQASVYTKVPVVGTLHDVYKCENQNVDPYVKMTSDGCKKYSGSCTVNRAYYCTTVEYIDCNRTSNGKTYLDPRKTTTTTKKTTTKTTTTKKTTTKRTTTNRKTTLSSKKTSTTKGTTTKTTTAITSEEKSNNANIKSIFIEDQDLDYANNKDKLEFSLPYGVENVKVTVEAEDKEASVIIEGNQNMTNESSEILITVTAPDGETQNVAKVSLIRYALLSQDCSLQKLEIKGAKIKFKKDKFEYRVKIPKDQEKVELKAVPTEEEKASYVIEGNEKLRNRSQILIRVTAEDGNECTYKVQIRKSRGIWKYVLLIILLLGGTAGGIYLAFRIVKKSKGKYKYE